MNFEENMKLTGEVQEIIDYLDGRREVIEVPNTILLGGRVALANSLANNVGPVFTNYVTTMVFGDGGVDQNGVKLYVNYGRSGLFGTTRLSKPVIATLNPTLATQVIFTSVILFSDIVGVAISEMALQMSNGNLYSMTTFPVLTKTAEMQVTYNWVISFC